MTRPLNWLAALCLALLLTCSHLLDGPTDLETAQAVADDLAQAEQSAIDSVAATAISTGSSRDFGKNTVVLASARAANTAKAVQP